MAGTPLSDQGLIGLLDVAECDETVELKLAVPDSDIASTRQALAFDLLDARIHRVAFFDPPDLALNRAGVVTRTRAFRSAAGVDLTGEQQTKTRTALGCFASGGTEQ